MGKKEQFKAKSPSCVYCGASSSTRDHVIPVCIFKTKGGDRKITVRVCNDCNQRKKHFDEILRDMLSVDMRTQRYPLAQEKFWGPFARAVIRRQSEVGRRITHESWSHELISRGGIYLGNVTAVDVNVEITEELRYIVRGLTAHYRWGVVEKDAEIRVALLDDVGVHRVSDTMQRHGEIFIDELGDGVATWAVQHSDANWSVWLVCFYQSLYFLVTVEPRDALTDGGEETAVAA